MMFFKEVKIPEYSYSNALGEAVLESCVVSFLDENEYKRYLESETLEGLEYALSGEDIQRGEEAIARNFLKERAREVLQGPYTLSGKQLRAVQLYTGKNHEEFVPFLKVSLSEFKEMLQSEDIGSEVSIRAFKLLKSLLND